MPDFSDRGYAIYPLAFIQAQAILDSPELDIEDAAPNQVASVYTNGGYAPVIINGGQLTSGNPSGGAYLAINSGAPFIVRGRTLALAARLRSQRDCRTQRLQFK